MRTTPALIAILLFASATSAGVAAPAAVKKDHPVVIQTIDERELTGVVDVRTDDRALWVRQEEANIVLATAVAWNNVASATVGGEATDVAALRSRSAELASGESTEMFAEIELPPSAIASRLTARAPRLRNLEILDIHLVNLDRNIEPDGLEVTIAAIGDDGAPLPVRGNIMAELVGERRPLYEPEPQFDELGRWSQPVRREDFVDGTATYVLRFRNTAPEWEFDLLPDAVLDVRLGAFGHGNFAASAPLVLRPFNPLRDNLQQARGTRFLPDEMRARPPLNGFGPQLGRWPWWPR